MLYGIGAQLDEVSELLSTHRGVGEAEPVVAAGDADALAPAAPVGAAIPEETIARRPAPSWAAC